MLTEDDNICYASVPSMSIMLMFGRKKRGCNLFILVRREAFGSRALVDYKLNMNNVHQALFHLMFEVRFWNITQMLKFTHRYQYCWFDLVQLKWNDWQMAYWGVLRPLMGNTVKAKNNFKLLGLDPNFLFKSIIIFYLHFNVGLFSHINIPTIFPFMREYTSIVHSWIFWVLQPSTDFDHLWESHPEGLFGLLQVGGKGASGK